MPAVFAHQHVRELPGVGEVAVVCEADAIRCIDVERLRLVGTVATRRRVAHVTDADVALQLQHVPLLEHVAHETHVLAQVQRAFVLGHDACRILSTMLQDGERVVDLLVDRRETHDTDDATHGCVLRYSTRRLRR